MSFRERRAYSDLSANREGNAMAAIMKEPHWKQIAGITKDLFNSKGCSYELEVDVEVLDDTFKCGCACFFLISVGKCLLRGRMRR